MHCSQSPARRRALLLGDRKGVDDSATDVELELGRDSFGAGVEEEFVCTRTLAGGKGGGGRRGGGSCEGCCKDGGGGNRPLIGV